MYKRLAAEADDHICLGHIYSKQVGGSVGVSAHDLV